MQNNEPKSSQTVAIVAAFFVGILAGGWFLFGSTSGASKLAADTADTADTAAPVASVPLPSDAQPSLPELERLKLENQILSAELENQKLQQRLATLTQHTNSGDGSLPGNRRESATAQRSNLQRPNRTTASYKPTGTPGERTLGFWNTMNSIIDSEAHMRATPPEGVNDNNAAAFMAKRIEAGQFAVDAFDGLDTTSVNRQAVSLASQLRKWYANGVKVCKTGQTVLNADAATRRGPAGLSWKASEFSHAAAVNSINKMGQSVRKAMSQKYGLDFPALK